MMPPPLASRPTVTPRGKRLGYTNCGKLECQRYGTLGDPRCGNLFVRGMGRSCRRVSRQTDLPFDVA